MQSFGYHMFGSNGLNFFDLCSEAEEKAAAEVREEERDETATLGSQSDAGSDIDFRDFGDEKGVVGSDSPEDDELDAVDMLERFNQDKSGIKGNFRDQFERLRAVTKSKSGAEDGSKGRIKRKRKVEVEGEGGEEEGESGDRETDEDSLDEELDLYGRPKAKKVVRKYDQRSEKWVGADRRPVRGKKVGRRHEGKIQQAGSEEWGQLARVSAHYRYQDVQSMAKIQSSGTSNGSRQQVVRGRKDRRDKIEDLERYLSEQFEKLSAQKINTVKFEKEQKDVKYFSKDDENIDELQREGGQKLGYQSEFSRESSKNLSSQSGKADARVLVEGLQAASVSEVELGQLKNVMVSGELSLQDLVQIVDKNKVGELSVQELAQLKDKLVPGEELDDSVVHKEGEIASGQTGANLRRVGQGQLEKAEISAAVDQALEKEMKKIGKENVGAIFQTIKELKKGKMRVNRKKGEMEREEDFTESAMQKGVKYTTVGEREGEEVDPIDLNSFGSVVKAGISDDLARAKAEFWRNMAGGTEQTNDGPRRQPPTPKFEFTSADSSKRLSEDEGSSDHEEEPETLETEELELDDEIPEDVAERKPHTKIIYSLSAPQQTKDKVAQDSNGNDAVKRLLKLKQLKMRKSKDLSEDVIATDGEEMPHIKDELVNVTKMPEFEKGYSMDNLVGGKTRVLSDGRSFDSEDHLLPETSTSSLEALKKERLHDDEKDIFGVVSQPIISGVSPTPLTEDRPISAPIPQVCLLQHYITVYL